MTIRPILPLLALVIVGGLVVSSIVLCAVVRKFRKVSNFRRLATLGLVVVALLRPSIVVQRADTAESNMNIYFAVDMTGSMIGKDCNHLQLRRYEKAAQDIRSIASHFAGARYAVFVQDFAPYPASPLTTDLNAINTISSIIRPKMSTASTGSDMQPLFDMVETYVKKYSQAYPNRQSILIYMSDGEETGDAKTTIGGGLQSLLTGGAVLGYGTAGGVEIETIEYDGSIADGHYIRDESGENHISKLDDDNLRSIANQLGVEYYTVTDADVPSVFYQNTINAVTEFQTVDTASYEDLYWLAALLIIALLLWEFYDVGNKLLSERNPQK